MSPPRIVSSKLSVTHGFFGREGGVSAEPFGSLNTSLSAGDDETAVAENRRRVTAALGADTLLTAKQIHSDRALMITEPFEAENRPEADALVTMVPGLAVGALAADCTPVLLHAPDMVAAVHAGWRGSLGGVLGSAVRLMCEHGASTDKIQAAIGPCLRRDHFEVRRDLIDAVVGAYPDAIHHFTAISADQSLYDHAGFVRDRLLEAGLAAHNIDDVGGDTLGESNRFFSYRGAQKAGLQRFGHNVSAIALPR